MPKRANCFSDYSKSRKYKLRKKFLRAKLEKNEEDSDVSDAESEYYSSSENEDLRSSDLSEYSNSSDNESTNLEEREYSDSGNEVIDQAANAESNCT